MDVLWLLLIVLGFGVLGLAGGLLLLAGGKGAGWLQKWAVPFAAGSLLAAAFLDLLPEAMEGDYGADEVLFWTLIGFAGFFVLGYVMNLLHKHSDEVHAHDQKAARMMIIADVVHTFIDGMVIGVSFLAGPEVGVVSALVVVAHEIPQEMGDFAIMIRAKMSKSKILVIQALELAMMIPGALLAYWVGDGMMVGLPIVLAVAAGFFIHIAASEVIPSLQKERVGRAAYREVIGVVAGMAVVWLMTSFL